VKKKPKRLVLNRETLSALSRATGGTGTYPQTEIGCPSYTCPTFCQYSADGQDTCLTNDAFCTTNYC
jgi:hypothetical protein